MGILRSGLRTARVLWPAILGATLPFGGYGATIGDGNLSGATDNVSATIVAMTPTGRIVLHAVSEASAVMYDYFRMERDEAIGKSEKVQADELMSAYFRLSKRTMLIVFADPLDVSLVPTIMDQLESGLLSRALTCAGRYIAYAAVMREGKRETASFYQNEIWQNKRRANAIRKMSAQLDARSSVLRKRAERLKERFSEQDRIEAAAIVEFRQLQERVALIPPGAGAAATRVTITAPLDSAR